MVIEFLVDKKIPPMFNHELSSYLYSKRGKTKELGARNGYKTSGWLDVMIFYPSELDPDCAVIQVNSFDIPEVYKEIRDELKGAIKEKVKIREKGDG